MNRKSVSELRREIESQVGVFPQRFASVLESPSALANLWDQTRHSLLENPIPHAFLMKLHQRLVEAADFRFELFCEPRLQLTTCAWPESDSATELAIGESAEAYFFDWEPEKNSERLKSLLTPAAYQDLIVFLLYNRFCLDWAKLHPESFPAAARAVDDREKLKRVFEQIPVAIAMLEGPAHHLSFANPCFVELFKLPEGFEGRSTHELFPGADSQGFLELQDRVFKTGERFTTKASYFEQTLLDGTKKPFYLDIIYEPLRDHSGGIIGIIALASNVTEQVMARRLLERGQERFNLALESARLGTWHIDMETLQVAASPLACEILGVESVAGTLHDWIGAAVHPDDREAVWTIWQAAVKTRTVYTQEYRILKPYGVVRWVLSRGLGDVGSDGQVRGFSGFMQDITEQKLADAKLAEQYRRFDTLVSSVPDLLAIYDSAGRFTYYNQAGLEATGLTPEEIIGKHSWEPEVFRGAPSDDFEARLAMVRETLKPQTDQFTIHSGEAERTFAYIVVPILDPYGGIEGFVSSARDVTDKIRSEKFLQVAKSEAERANAAKSSFLANMSHEIRTPLGAMIGFAELLKDESASPIERRNYLEIITRNGQNLSKVIDDILDLSKVEAGRMEIEHVPVAICDLLAEVQLLFSDRVKLKRIAMSSVCDMSVPQMVMTDPVRLRQILINIVGNAVKFTDKGRVDLAAHATLLDSNRARIEISVIDTGRGLTETQSQTLFQPFVQADVSTTRQYGGTGLGLALSRRLAQALSGDIEIRRSVPEEGSNFVVTIEAEISGASRRVQEQSQQVEEGPVDLSGVRVLLVEDSLDNQFLFRRILMKSGATVTIANNGEEGVEKAMGANFDVVLLDIQMPVMDGYQAIAELKKRGYARPVLALTAHAMAEERKRTQEAGFCAHVTKPIDRRELLGMVKRWAVVRD